jgi:hypothetical protein
MVQRYVVVLMLTFCGRSQVRTLVGAILGRLYSFYGVYGIWVFST